MTQDDVIEAAIRGLKEIETELDEYVDIYKKYPYIQSFGFVKDDLSTDNCAMNGYCLSPWRRIEGNVIAMYQCPHKAIGSFVAIKAEFRKAWIEYMFDPKISPWRPFIKWGTTYKGQDIYDPEFVSKVGYIHYTDDYNTNIAHIMMALRDPYEHSRRVHLWHELTKAGVDPTVAFVFTRNYRQGDNYAEDIHPIEPNTKLYRSCISHTHVEWTQNFSHFIGLIKQLKVAEPNKPNNNWKLFTDKQFTDGGSVSKIYDSVPYARADQNLAEMFGKYFVKASSINHMTLRPRVEPKSVLLFSEAVRMLQDITKEYNL